MTNNQEKLTVIENDKTKEKSLYVTNETIKESQENESIINNTELNPETAKKDALEVIKSIETKSNKLSSSEEKNKLKTSIKGSIRKNEVNNTYKKILKDTQKDLNFSKKAYSKFIHIPVIEKASDPIGSTIAKPNAMLSGSIFAFIFTLLTYTIAKKIGYQLSGFETIGSFVLGWIFGMIYDYLKVLFTGKK